MSHKECDVLTCAEIVRRYWADLTCLCRKKRKLGTVEGIPVLGGGVCPTSQGLLPHQNHKGNAVENNFRNQQINYESVGNMRGGWIVSKPRTVSRTTVKESLRKFTFIFIEFKLRYSFSWLVEFLLGCTEVVLTLDHSVHCCQWGFCCWCSNLSLCLCLD